MRTGWSVFNLVLVCLGLLSAVVPAHAVPPNIIFVLTDDQAQFETDYMPLLQTNLVQKGMTFSNAFVTTANCCPSRASILRGQYVHNHGVLTNRYPTGGFQKFYELGLESETLATWLQGLGYRTGLAGKYLNGYGDVGFQNYVPPGWDDWNGLVIGSSYNRFTLVEDGVPVAYSTPSYLTDVLAQKAVDFINRYAEDSRPFFFYLSPIAPHKPWQPAERHKGAYAGLIAPRSLAFNEADVSDKPSYVSGLPLLESRDITQIDKDFASRMESLLSVDEAVDGIIKALDAIGQLNNTYIVFTSDNGWLNGEHRFAAGKGVPYDPAVRVPLIIRGPGLRGGTTRDAQVLNIDFAPTFVELAGGRRSSIIDGRSLVPLFRGAAPRTWRSRFLLEYWKLDEMGEDAIVPNYFALRSTSRLYADYYDLGERELYDLDLDPGQLENVYGSADPLEQQDLDADLSALAACAGASCRELERN